MKMVVMFVAAMVALLSASCASNGHPATTEVQNGAPTVTRVQIDSVWSGLGSSKPAHLMIVRQGDRYRSGARRFEESSIIRLLAAIEDQSPSATATEYDIPQAWLDQNAEAAFDDLRANYSRWTITPEMRQLFIAAFRNRDLIMQLLEASHRSITFDDYPRVDVSMTLSTGDSIAIHSEQQSFFMIPWSIERNGEVVDMTFNPEVGISIAALLPKGSANRARLRGDGLRATVANLVVFKGIASEWGMLDSRRRLGYDFDRVATRFEIKESQIGHISSVDVHRDDETWSWIATLRKPGLPPNFTIGLDLPFKKEKAIGIDQFLSRVDVFIDQTLAVPWLRRFAENSQASTIELRFVDDRSLSPHAAEWYSEHAWPGTVARTRDKLASAAFLQITEPECFSRWLILPDGSAVLWEATSNGKQFCGGSVAGRNITGRVDPDRVGSAELGIMFDSRGEAIP